MISYAFVSFPLSAFSLKSSGIERRFSVSSVFFLFLRCRRRRRHRRRTRSRRSSMSFLSMICITIVLIIYPTSYILYKYKHRPINTSEMKTFLHVKQIIVCSVQCTVYTDRCFVELGLNLCTGAFVLIVCIRVMTAHCTGNRMAGAY